jgi:hypothetical protein
LSTNSSTARGRTDLLEQQIREIEALTEDVRDPGVLARLEAELVATSRHRQRAARNEDGL